MEKKAIGFKKKISTPLVIAMIVGGLALFAGSSYYFVYMIQGAFDGGIAGGTVALSVILVKMGVVYSLLPSVLIQIDEASVYLHKKSIRISEIKNIENKGDELRITTVNGKRILQGFLKNCEECSKQIRDAISAYNAQQQ